MNMIRLLACVAGSACLSGCAAAPGSMTRPGGLLHPRESVGLVERLAAGNIDQPGSPAYFRWGAGYESWLGASDRKFGRP